jgi:hypothetical protein
MSKTTPCDIVHPSNPDPVIKDFLQKLLIKNPKRKAYFNEIMTIHFEMTLTLKEFCKNQLKIFVISTLNQIQEKNFKTKFMKHITSHWINFFVAF